MLFSKAGGKTLQSKLVITPKRIMQYSFHSALLFLSIIVSYLRCSGLITDTWSKHGHVISVVAKETLWGCSPPPQLLLSPPPPSKPGCIAAWKQRPHTWPPWAPSYAISTGRHILITLLIRTQYRVFGRSWSVHHSRIINIYTLDF